MSADAQRIADERLTRALAESGAPDPRGGCRDQLRRLRRRSPERYEEGVAYYRNRLVPSIAGEEADPLAAWRDYALFIAELASPGRAVAVDEEGRSRPFAAPGKPADMVLHLPDRNRAAAVLIALPPEPSAAQRATRDWLVLGRRELEQ